MPGVGGNRTDCCTTEVLEVTKWPTQGMLRPIYRERVAASWDPDGQDAQDENHICRHDNGPEAIGQDTVLYDPGQGDCKSGFGPARGYGRHRCRRMVKSEKRPLVIVGVIADCSSAAQERTRNQQDQLLR